MPILKSGAQPSSASTGEMSAHAWDEFLRENRCGQFQQSSAWAEAKSHDGWNPVRRSLTVNGTIYGGFQILWRATKIGRIGYISKGPVLVKETPDLWRQALQAAASVARHHSLRGLIIQPPDLSDAPEEVFRTQGLLPERLMEVIDASLWVDLRSQGPVWDNLHRQTRKYIRHAQRSGVIIREGGEADLGAFFQLMSQTSARQGSKPNPPSEAALRQIWRAFATNNAIRLTLAILGDRTLAGMICILHGDRATLWKKGATADSSDSRANHLICFEALHWAQEKGFAHGDFYAVRRDIAEALLAGNSLTEEQNSSRDRFILGFGGAPRLLPGAKILFSSHFFSVGYKIASKLARIRKPSKSD